MSVALVYVVVSVSDTEFWTVTVSVVMSALLSVNKNLWLASDVSTVYVAVINDPSYTGVSLKTIEPATLLPVMSDIVTKE